MRQLKIGNIRMMALMAENKEKILQSILNSVDIGQVKEQTY